MPRISACFTVLAVLGTVVLMSGCGGQKAGRVPVYEVSGKVTLSGGPVAGAVVSFSPKEKQPVAIGTTSADGSYILTTYEGGDGAAAGNYLVLITKSAPSGQTNTPPTGHDAANAQAFDSSAAHAAQKKDAAAAAAPGGLLPARYGRMAESDLVATVKPEGPNEFNFDLKP